MIKEFQDEYRFLSNFHPSVIHIDGYGVFRTAEHLYQSFKTLDPDEHDSVLECETPGAVKRLGSKLTLRSDWESVKDRAMEITVARKFQQNPHLLDMLLATHTQELVEGNTWHDNYWGACSCEKCENKPQLNILGKTLMAYRDEAYIWSKLDI